MVFGLLTTHLSTTFPKEKRIKETETCDGAAAANKNFKLRNTGNDKPLLTILYCWAIKILF